MRKSETYRNEIKSYIVRTGMTMTEVVDYLSDEYGWSRSVPNLSGKLKRNVFIRARVWRIGMIAITADRHQCKQQHQQHLCFEVIQQQQHPFQEYLQEFDMLFLRERRHRKSEQHRKF